MPKLHETQMGQRVFTSLLPRLVTAVEQIATYLENSEKVEVLELALNLPRSGRVECKDGFSFILTRHEDEPVYTVSFYTFDEPLFEKHAVGHNVEGGIDLSGIYTRDIPAITVAEVIKKHGGIVDV